jgi:thiamine-monophosphate kinase
LNLEKYFISQFNSKNIGDDGAYIDGYVYSKDAFFENVHFKRKWMSCYKIAQKSILVNISDAIAMNAQPKYALLSVAMPKNITKTQMKDLVAGFEETAALYDVEIIGGDTLSNSKLDITVTIISQTKKPLNRTKIRSGMLLAYTGVLGNSHKDLKKLFNLGSLHEKSKFVNLILRDEFIKRSSRILKAGMDISDGLGDDLGKIASINRIGFDFFKPIKKNILCSGEEYEMLVAFDKRDLKAIRRKSVQARTPLTIFASAQRKKYVNRCKSHHF